MEECLMEMLIKFGIDLQDCRGQSYDNASNMAGMYSGLQARIKSKNNLAIYVPCGAHSLNLIGACAAESCLEATKLFFFVQSIYNFFAASTTRWEILKRRLSVKCKVPKTLSNTRWSARAESVNALVLGYDYFKQALNDISIDLTQKLSTRVEAEGLEKQFNSLETALMLSFWNDILETMNKINISLQKTEIEIETVVKLYTSLKIYIEERRNIDSFNYYKRKGEELSGCLEFKTARILKRKKQFDEGASADTQFDKNVGFRINTFYVIIDTLLAEISKRKSAYDHIASKFEFLMNLKKFDENMIREKANILYKYYPDDLEKGIIEECLHFKHVDLLSDNSMTLSKPELILKTIIESQIESTFPNITTALRIFLSIACTNCSGERSFSTLKRIKNYLRSSLEECKLNNLSILAIESDLLEGLDHSEIINIFAQNKCRKMQI